MQRIEDNAITISENLTGFPSMDMPHTKFYIKPRRNIDVEQTIYNLVFSNVQKMQSPALEYLGIEWTFEMLKNAVDKAAVSFHNSGLNCGDTVLVGVSNCPEAVIALFALNKIGVVSKWFDIRSGEKDIEEYANESSCKYLIAYDLLLPKIINIINSTNLEKIIIITPADSLPVLKRMGYSIKENLSIPNDDRFVMYREFINHFYDGKNLNCVAFDRNRASIMIQSSGTTGKPKVIVHSDYSATSNVKSLSYSDMPIGEGKILLNLLPPWIAYSLGTAIIYPLSLGAKVIISPTFEPEIIMQYIGKFTIAFTAPPPYRYLYDHFDELSSTKKKRFYSMVEGLGSGGDKITIDENERFENKFRTILFNGYGDNEAWSVLTVNPVRHNKYGSVGIAKYGDAIIAYDNEKQKELKYNEIGEICALTDTTMLYYEGNPKETKKVLRLHPDGKLWLHTGDLGYIDEEGFVFLKGRLRRVITRLGFKISAVTIEDNISNHFAVKECVVVEVKDNTEEHVPMAFVVLNSNLNKTKEEILKSIIKKCKKELKEYEVPKYIKFVDELTYTNNGKYDFRQLEKLGDEHVNSLFLYEWQPETHK